MAMICKDVCSGGETKPRGLWEIKERAAMVEQSPHRRCVSTEGAKRTLEVYHIRSSEAIVEVRLHRSRLGYASKTTAALSQNGEQSRATSMKENRRKRHAEQVTAPSKMNMAAMEEEARDDENVTEKEKG
eukprot:Gb_33980 [translate_table: standard]